MRLLAPHSALLDSRDVRLISILVQCAAVSRIVPPLLPRPWATCRSPTVSHTRGAKTKATKKLKDLQQGIIQAEPLPELEADDAPQYPAVVQGAKNNMIKFHNCVVLTRVGNFYEVGQSSIAALFRPSLTEHSCISIMLNNLPLFSTSSWPGRKRMRDQWQWQAFLSFSLTDS